MKKSFDIDIFLAGVLRGAHTTRKRHIRQAKVIQSAIASRWHLENPWSWQKKHLVWFVKHHISMHSESTRYYYLLTIILITKRLGKTWSFSTLGGVRRAPQPAYIDKRVEEDKDSRTQSCNPSSRAPDAIEP